MFIRHQKQELRPKCMEKSKKVSFFFLVNTAKDKHESTELKVDDEMSLSFFEGIKSFRR